ncbi:MAG: hypothetical protein HY657_02355 [Acidobacteria bacterium]|nr:hypothetical protein [Acidobacteriota bacterium]
MSALVDSVPEAGEAAVTELRMRIFAERVQDVGGRLRLNLSAYVDGLVADRTGTGGRGAASDAVVRPGDLYAEVYTRRFDLRIGASRLVWGRLDELQPTDVVNPVDLTRFVLEGRTEARLPVALARARVFLPGSSTLEGVIVPAFRASRFDQLDEQTSPFNLAGPVIADRREPPVAWKNLQGGARFTSTAGRVDWGVSAYRGFRSFPVITAVGRATTPHGAGAVWAPASGSPDAPIALFPRFTMLGADFETVRGAWGMRGEVATFLDDPRAFEGGAGLDRRAGDYRVAANVLVSRDDQGTDATLIAAAERSFARETRTLRLFAAYDPVDATSFVRGIAAVSLRDDVWVEGSVGLFTGASAETLGQLSNRDFVYARLKVFF